MERQNCPNRSLEISELKWAKLGEIPNSSEDEPMLSARIGASFVTKFFRHAHPGG
jgi:hypothetical protein